MSNCCSDYGTYYIPVSGGGGNPGSISIPYSVERVDSKNSIFSQCDSCIHNGVCMHSADYQMIQMKISDLRVEIDGIEKKLSDIPWLDLSRVATCKNYRKDVNLR